MVNRYILAGLLIFLSSCVSKKITTESVQKKSRFEKVVKDSAIIVRVSEPIRDTIVINMKTNNKVVDSIVDSKLKYLTAVRSSGTNRVKIVYDTIYKTVKIETQVQGSSNEKVTTQSDTTKENNTKSERTQETVKTNNTKLYLYIGVVILLLGAFGGVKLYKKFWL